MKIRKKYKIHYSYGMHHIWIDTNKESFEYLIKDMEEEFEIIKENRYTEDYTKKHSRMLTEYKIVNYHGDMETIGKIERFYKRDTIWDIWSRYQMK